MRISRNSSELSISPEHVSLVEFGFGILALLMGAYGIAPTIGIQIAILITFALLLPLILYIVVAMIVGSNVEWTSDEKVVYALVFIMLFSSSFLVDIIGDDGLALIAIACGLILILLSIGHFVGARREHDIPVDE